MVDVARGLLARSRAGGAEIPLPTDVVVAKEFAASAEADVKPVADVAADEMILDIGPDTAEKFAAALKGAGTVVWNGPVGVFEFDQFGEGTRTIAQAVARSPAFSIAGGGDTIAAIEKYGVGRISLTSRRPAAPSLNSSRARSCPPWKCSSSALRARKNGDGRPAIRCSRRRRSGARLR